MLDLGFGTSETSRRLAELYPDAELTALDASEKMLAAASVILAERSPVDPADARSRLSEFDRPSSVDEQLDWLRSAGLRPALHWTHEDLVVLSADRPLAAAT
jgi:Methyltransferase domain